MKKRYKVVLYAEYEGEVRPVRERSTYTLRGARRLQSWWTIPGPSFFNYTTGIERI